MQAYVGIGALKRFDGLMPEKGARCTCGHDLRAVGLLGYRECGCGKHWEILHAAIAGHDHFWVKREIREGDPHWVARGVRREMGDEYA
jgi:hypothetical protein